MFDDETNVEEGITLRVYTFKHGGTNEEVMSILPRMIGEKTDIGYAVLNPFIEASKAATKLQQKALQVNALKAPKKPWFGKTPKPSAEFEEYKVKVNELNAKYANPLFDLPRDEAKGIIATVIASFIEKGLAQVKHDKRSNGDMIEEVYLFR